MSRYLSSLDEALAYLAPCDMWQEQKPSPHSYLQVAAGFPSTWGDSISKINSMK